MFVLLVLFVLFVFFVCLYSHTHIYIYLHIEKILAYRYLLFEHPQASLKNSTLQEGSGGLGAGLALKEAQLG